MSQPVTRIPFEDKPLSGYRRQRIENFIELQIADIDDSLHFLDKDHSVTQLKVVVEKIYTLFNSTQEFFADSNLNFLYIQHKRALSFFSSIFFKLVDKIDQLEQEMTKRDRDDQELIQSSNKHPETIKHPNHQWKPKRLETNQVLLAAQTDHTNQLIQEQLSHKNKTVGSHQNTRKRLPKMGGIYLYNQQHKRNIQNLSNSYLTNFNYSGSEFKRGQGLLLPTETLKYCNETETREEAQARYEKEEIELFMKEHRPLVTGVKKMLCSDQMQRLESSFKQSHHLALQFLKSSKIDYLGKAECIGNFNHLYICYQEQKQELISNMNLKLTELFQIIKQKKEQLDKACQLEKQKIQQLEDKLKREVRNIECQTSIDFLLQNSNLKFKLRELEADYKRLQTLKQKEVQIQHRNFTKEVELTHELIQKKLLNKKLEETLVEKDRIIEQIKNQISRLSCKLQSSGNKSFMMLSEAEKQMLMKQLIQHFYRQNVLSSNGIQMQTLNKLSSFQKQISALETEEIDQNDPYDNLMENQYRKKKNVQHRLMKHRHGKRNLQALFQRSSTGNQVSSQSRSLSSKEKTLSRFAVEEEKSLENSHLSKYSDQKTPIEEPIQKMGSTSQSAYMRLTDISNQNGENLKLKQRHFTPIKISQNVHNLENMKSIGERAFRGSINTVFKKLLSSKNCKPSIISPKNEDMNSQINQESLPQHLDEDQRVSEGSQYSQCQNIVIHKGLHRQNSRMNFKSKLLADSSMQEHPESLDLVCSNNKQIKIRHKLFNKTYHHSIQLRNTLQAQEYQMADNAIVISKQQREKLEISKSRHMPLENEGIQNSQKLISFTPLKSQSSLVQRKTQFIYKESSIYQPELQKVSRRVFKVQKPESRFRYRQKQKKEDNHAKLIAKSLDKDQHQAMVIASNCKNKEEFRKKMIIIHMERCGKKCNHLKRFCQNYQKYRRLQHRKPLQVHVENLNQDSSLIG